METINNLTSAASKVIWGEGQSHEEPVSGKMGNVAAGEPYDAGNIEPNEAALETPGKKDTETPNEPATVTRTTGRTAPEPMPKPEPEAATKPRFVEAKPTPSETTEKANTNQAANPSGPAGSAPSAVGMRDDSTKAQNDTRPPPEGPFASTARTPAADTSTTNTTDTTTAGTPTKIPGTAATTTDKPDEEQQQPQPQPTTDPLPNPSPTKDKDTTTTTPAINLDGPGPRPLEEIAREHGGDAAGHQRRDSGKGIADEEEGGEKSAGGGAEGTGEGQW